MDNRLRKVRLEKGMTQTELSKKSGVSRCTINGIEKGHRLTVLTETLLKLARALGVSVSDLFFDQNV